MVNLNRDYLKAYNLINRNLQNNKFNINFGGDHSIAVSTIQPLLDKYKNDLLVIWIDAHADINTMETSVTKNKHGMPVASLMGLMDHWYDIEPKHYLQPNNLFYFGLRDVDGPEAKVILEKNIHVSECKMPCEKYKYASSINNIIHKILLHPAKYIHISCDIDGLDPSIMPSTGTPVENGLKLEDVISIISITNKKLVSFDLVEFNPLIGNDNELELTLNNIKTIISQVIKK
jgi:arginase